jgi:tRNA(His) 5'-end guanylyltransferase
MATRDSLGDRMKSNYENRAKYTLTRRTPVIIRLDGKAFHTFTKHLKKPYDLIFHDAMDATLKYLCENIQGCKFGYTQSDEITLAITDFDTLDTDAWFDYEVQKMCSISASMATFAFNRAFSLGVSRYMFCVTEGEETSYINALECAVARGGMFDARCFNIPEDEICNNFIWRQNDATRNSIQMVGHANFSDKELHKKSCNDIQDMLMIEKGINWNDFPTHLKRGSCCIKQKLENWDRPQWVIDTEIPIFKGDGRKYIDNFVYCLT